MTEEDIKQLNQALEEALKPLTEKLDRLIERTEAFEANINGFTFVQDDSHVIYAASDTASPLAPCCSRNPGIEGESS